MAKDTIDYSILNEIQKDFFTPYVDFVDVDPTAEGNPIRDNRMLFGARNGPICTLNGLLHEMAHCVEIDDARCHKWGWGLQHGTKQTIAGQDYFDMFTPQAIHREIRTFGIQMVLHRHYGITAEEIYSIDEDDTYVTQIMNHAKVCDYIQGFLHFYPKGWREKTSSYADIKEYAFQHIGELIAGEIDKWDFDSIMREWDRKMVIIGQRQRNGWWADFDTLK